MFTIARSATALAGAAALLLVFGCSGAPDVPAGPELKSTGAGAPDPTMEKLAGPTAGASTADPHQGAGPSAANVPSPHSSEVGGDEDPDVAKAILAAESAEAKLKSAPTNAALKRQAAEAATVAGDAMMTRSTQSMKVKYRSALRLFRRALELDPASKRAQDGRDLIEGIYKQMGRPIPK